MSLGNPAVDCFSIYEPRMNLSNVAQRQFAIVRGGNSITPYIYPAISFSQSSLQFQCNPPSRSTVLDRIAIVRVNVTLTFAGTASGLVGMPNNLLRPQYDAFRSWPISSVANTLVSQINGYGVAIELSKMVHAITRFNQPSDLRNFFLSATTDMDDNCQDYRSVVGSNVNPLGVFTDNSNYPARGAYPYTLVSNTSSGAVVTADLYEYLLLPPYIFDGCQSGGLTHIDTLTFTYNIGNLARMWSHCPNDNVDITSLNVVVNNAAMNLFYITPRLNSWAEK